MLVSSTEPFNFKTLGKSSMVPERYGCDFLIVANKTKTGIQRKKFPNDLLASLTDGRLYEQVHKMEALDRALIVFEGYGKWTLDGELIDYASFTKQQFHSLVMSLAFEFGVEVFVVKDMNETIQFLTNIENWARKLKHTSLRTRPGPKKDSWGRVGIKEIGLHFLQSFQGVGPTTAERIWDHFGGVPVKWEIEVEELLAIRGIGRPTAIAIYKGLERVRVGRNEDV